jgi:hypothetical protein
MQYVYADGATPLDRDVAQGLIPRLTTQSDLNEFEQMNIQSALGWASRSKKLRAELVSLA